MSTMRVVEALDLVEHVGPRRIPRAINASVHTFCLQGAEEAFYRGVDAPIVSRCVESARSAKMGGYSSRTIQRFRHR